MRGKVFFLDDDPWLTPEGGGEQYPVKIFWSEAQKAGIQLVAGMEIDCRVQRPQFAALYATDLREVNAK
jgi:hypothetical protein